MIATPASPAAAASAHFASTQHLPSPPLPTPALRSLDRLGFTRLVEHHLGLARRHGSCAAVILLTLDGDAAVTQDSTEFTLLAQALRNRLRGLLRRSDTLHLIEGRALGVVLSEVQPEGVSLVQRRLAEAVRWAPELRPGGRRPVLRIGTALDSESRPCGVEAGELVWRAEQDLQVWPQ